MTDAEFRAYAAQVFGCREDEVVILESKEVDDEHEADL